MSKFCCNDLRYHISHECDIHSNVFDCPDCLLFYNDVFDEYGMIIHDGGSSYIAINFCPFCGYGFSKSKRGIYYDVLNKLHINSEDEIPEEFKTDEWWKKRGL